MRISDWSSDVCSSDLGEDAVARTREVMGATNPAQADEGTIRKEFAESIEANSVHGSDSLENAKIEIAFFFKPEEIVGKSDQMGLAEVSETKHPLAPNPEHA